MSERRKAKKRKALRLRIAVVVALLVAGLAAGWLYKEKGKVNADELLVRATTQFEAGDYQSSAIDLKAVLSEQPDNRDARFLLGRVYMKAGNPRGALKEFERAREFGLNNPEIGQGITRALLLTGQFDQAATELAINGDTSQPDWLVLRGMLDLSQQRIDDARATFVALLEAHPDHEQARRGLMQAELAAGNADLARAEVQKLLDLAPDAGLWVIKGELELYDANVEAATDAFAAALALEPNNPAARLGGARAALETGDLDAASNHLDELGQAGEEDPRVNYLRARIAELREDPNSALHALRKVLQVAPMHGDSLVLAAKLHFSQGEFTRAQDYVSRILEIEPGNAAAQRMLGAIQLAAGRMDGLEDIAASPTQPESQQDPGMLALLGTAYLKHGRYADSTASLARAVELAPDSLPIRTQLAMSRIATGEYATAIAELEGILAEDPTFTQAEISLVMVHVAAADNAAAISAAEGLVQKNPESALAHNVLGYVFEVSDQRPQALAAYTAALERDALFHPARINLARMAIADGDNEGGRQQFKKILDDEPFHAFALLGLAALALQDDNLDEAERLWLQAREHNPDAVAPRLLLAKHYRAKSNQTQALTMIREAYRLAPYAPQVQAAYAAQMLESGDFPEALEAAQSLVARVPNSVEGLELLAHTHNRLGNAEGLRETLEKIAEIAPEAAGARLLLGRLAIRRKDFAAADKIAGDLLAMPDGAAAGYEIRGDALMAQEQPEKALAAYREAFATTPGTAILLKLDALERTLGQDKDRLTTWLEDHPDDLQVRLVRASLMQQVGSGASAIPEYERMLSAQTENPVVLNNLAWLYHEAGDERAMALAQRAFELAPRSPEIMDTYGWIMFLSGKTEQGLKLLQQAEEAAPDNPDIQYHTASALHGSGAVEQARTKLTTLLEAHKEFPSRQQAEQLLAKLGSE